MKTGHGGIRDIEFVIQFLQLLNGGDLPELRTGNTLEAMAQLEQRGCLTNQERSLLDENYNFLRKIEHRLQIMFDLQTHLLPARAGGTAQAGVADGLRGPARASRPWTRSWPTTANKTALNRKILDHLLHDAFGDDAQTEAEVDLVLDPDPPPERIAEVLGKYHFRDVKQAYRNLMAWSRRRFASSRRAAAGISWRRSRPQLLAGDRRHGRPRLDAGEPRPGERLAGRQGRALGTVQLQPAQPAAVRRALRLQPAPLGHPDQQPGHDRRPDGQPGAGQAARPRGPASRRSAELCRAAEDIEPILHSFKNDQQLRVGVRDILGKEDIQATTGALSDIAEACLAQIAAAEYQKLIGQVRPAAHRRRAAGRASRATWSSWRWASSAAGR